MTQRRRSQRRLSYSSEEGERSSASPEQHDAPPQLECPAETPCDHAKGIQDLPDELLLQVFKQLATLPPVLLPEEEALYTRSLPFRTFEFPGELHPGLRAYPFLAQVCRHWRAVLESGEARQALWSELVVDFGHELITGVHVPVRWSDVRPSDDEFREAFASVRLRCHRLVDFVRERRRVLRRLVLANSEGYWAEDGEFVPLASKHNFSLGTLGIMLGMLDGLEELSLVHCNDLFAAGSPLPTVAMLSGLRSLTLDDVQCRLYREPLAELGRLTQLTQLTISSTQRHGVFLFGMDAVPDTWAYLSNLRSLELRGNALLEALPDWLPGAMPHLELLDVSACARLDMRGVAAFTQLRTLAVQAMDLVCGATPPRLVAQAAQHGVVARAKALPDLSPLTRLRALNLADNNMGELPASLFKLTGLEVLDLSGNFFLELSAPLAQLHAFTRLRWLDMRAVHVEDASNKFWSEAKCTTMQHVSAMAKALRRKNRRAKVLYDTS